VAPDARVLPLRVLNGNGTGSTSDGIEAFNWAGAKGIRVVNASLGGLGFSASEYATIAKYPDTLFVVAAGNEGQDNDNSNTAQYPCAYDLDNILCVGASDGNEARADFSNFGATSVDLYAPGVDIASTMLGQYWRSAGTSMATPHVAATAALLAARNPTLTAIELKRAILDEAKPVAAGPRLDATAALGAVPADADGDLDLDAADNCPSVFNPGQQDADRDSTGDACEAGANAVNRDADTVPDVADTVPDVADACPDEPWPTSDGCPLAAVTAPDTDHDGVPNTRDLCPNVTVSGGFGCRDDDDDRVPNDGRDNCPYVANTNQIDADADGAGDACDGSPRGLDTDGDGKPALDDACPTVHGTLANGCPPPPTPSDRDGDGRPDAVDACPDEPATTPNGCPIAQIGGISPRVKKRTATVTVSTDRAATVRILVQRRKARGWVRVTSKTRPTVSNRVSLTVKRLKLGTHRARVTIKSSGGEGTPRAKTFRVR
jgi:Subtilase family/Thrombospondin type 3 repeat